MQNWIDGARAHFGRTALRKRKEALSAAANRTFLNWRKTWQPFSKTYSQFGEDLIVDGLLGDLGIEQAAYLDIGAHDAFECSNTALLYSKGCCGVCVEPDPFLHRRLQRKRKRDICLNVGVGVGDVREADFFVLSHKGLSTFIKEEAERCQQYGYTLEKVLKIPMLSFHEIVEKYCVSCPNFVSLDVEGFDFAVLQTIDFTRFRPEVFCVETIEFTQNNTGRKLTEIMDLISSQGYFVYADTHLNTIFVDQLAWESRNVA